MNDENKSPHAENKDINPVAVAWDDNATVQTQNIHVGNGDEKNGDSRILSTNEGAPDYQVDAVSNSLESLGLIGSISEQKG